jgi:hypothetical protein
MDMIHITATSRVEEDLVDEGPTMPSAGRRVLGWFASLRVCGLRGQNCCSDKTTDDD